MHVCKAIKSVFRPIQALVVLLAVALSPAVMANGLKGLGIPGLGNGGGGLFGIGPKRGSIGRGKEPFPVVLDKNDLDCADFDATALATNVWSTIGRYTVPAGQSARWGSGGVDQSHNQGYMYVKLMDDTCIAVQEHGKIRLVITNPQATRVQVAWEGRTNQLDGSKTNRDSMTALPLTGVEAQEDDRLEVQFKPDNADSLDATDSSFEVFLPATLYQ